MKRFLAMVWRIWGYLAEKKPLLGLVIFYPISGLVLSAKKTLLSKPMEPVEHPWMLALIIVLYIVCISSPLYTDDEDEEREEK